jgi:hypothetical protein
MIADSDVPQQVDWVNRAASVLVLALAVFGFAKASWSEPGSVWLASYSDETATAPYVTRESNVNHLWGKNNQTPPEGLDPRTSRVRIVSCLHTERALDLPLQLVAVGEAQFRISGAETLSIQETSGRGAQGKVIHLEPGVYGFSVEFASRSARPGVALNASFDGKAPRPTPSASLPSGVYWSRPKSADGDPCAGL